MEYDALPGKLVVVDLESGRDESEGGIILNDATGKSEGIRSRWARVHKVGAGLPDTITEGKWVLVQHGRWTRAIEIDGQNIWMVDPDSVTMVIESDEKPDYTPVGLQRVKEYTVNADSFRDFAGNRFQI